MTEPIFERFEEETAYTDELAAEYHKQGLWGEMSCADYLELHARERGDRPAVIDDRRTLTWGDLYEEARRLAAGFRDLGIERGDRVAYQLPHRAEWHVTRLAIAEAGGIAVPLVPRFREQEISHVLTDVEASIYIGPAEYKDYDHIGTALDLEDDLDSLGHVFALGEGIPAGVGSFDDIPADPSGFEPDRIHPDYPDTLNTTSGTTGIPKVYYLQQNGRITMAQDVIGRYCITGYDDMLVLAPIQQATGELMAYYVPLVSGVTIRITEEEDPVGQWESITAHEPSYVAAIPTQMTKMMNADGSEDYSLDFVRVFANAGAPLPEETARFFEDKDTVTANFYGASEGGLPHAICPMDAEGVRFSSVGKPVPSMQTKIIDGNGNELDAGEVGEVIWRGGNQEFGYYRDREATAEAFDLGGAWEGWFHSGDAGTLDEDGNLAIVGRMDDMIIRGGQNIYPSEIEDELMKHDAVAEAAIVGMPDPEYGERACAYVVPAGGSDVTLGDLTGFLDERGFAKYMWPERLETTDELPRSPGGKIRKTDLEDDIESKLRREGKIE